MRNRRKTIIAALAVILAMALAAGLFLTCGTVVIQYTTVGTSRLLEHGSRPPYAHSIGSGDALVLRDGKAFQARWSLPSADSGTTFTTVSGQPMTFAPGPVWMVLAARRTAPG
jgi:Protein of unknown function (DUF3048) C-terminal domain